MRLAGLAVEELGVCRCENMVRSAKDRAAQRGVASGTRDHAKRQLSMTWP